MQLIWMVRVQSRSIKGKKWVVRHIEEGKEKVWVCHCPAFLFKNPNKKACFHIERAKKQWIKKSRRVGNCN